MPFLKCSSLSCNSGQLGDSDDFGVCNDSGVSIEYGHSGESADSGKYLNFCERICFTLIE